MLVVSLVPIADESTRPTVDGCGLAQQLPGVVVVRADRKARRSMAMVVDRCQVDRGPARLRNLPRALDRVVAVCVRPGRDAVCCTGGHVVLARGWAFECSDDVSRSARVKQKQRAAGRLPRRENTSG